MLILTLSRTGIQMHSNSAITWFTISRRTLWCLLARNYPHHYGSLEYYLQFDFVTGHHWLSNFNYCRSSINSPRFVPGPSRYDRRPKHRNFIFLGRILLLLRDHLLTKFYSPRTYTTSIVRQGLAVIHCHFNLWTEIRLSIKRFLHSQHINSKSCTAWDSEMKNPKKQNPQALRYWIRNLKLRSE